MTDDIRKTRYLLDEMSLVKWNVSLYWQVHSSKWNKEGDNVITVPIGIMRWKHTKSLKISSTCSQTLAEDDEDEWSASWSDKPYTLHSLSKKQNEVFWIWGWQDKIPNALLGID
jgi:hypothetical protein